MMMDDNSGMDAVIAFVDSDTPGWEEVAEKYALLEGRDADDPDLSGPCRYRKTAPLKLQVLLIRKFMPFVGRIFITVPSKAHLLAEDLSDLENIFVVENKDHIPSEFLPTFNAFAVEWFLDQIPGLGDRFLYMNDDVYPCRGLSKADFIRKDGTLPLALEGVPVPVQEGENYNRCCADTTSLVWGLFRKDGSKPPRLLRACHAIHVFDRKDMAEARGMLGSAGLVQDLSRFRNYHWRRGNKVTLSPPTFYSMYTGLKQGRFNFRGAEDMIAFRASDLVGMFDRAKTALHSSRAMSFVVNDLPETSYSMYSWALMKHNLKLLLEGLLEK